MLKSQLLLTAHSHSRCRSRSLEFDFQIVAPHGLLQALSGDDAGIKVRSSRGMIGAAGSAPIGRVGLQPPSLSLQDLPGRLPSIAAYGRFERSEATQPSRITFEEPPETLPTLEVRSSPGRGLGLFATHAIAAYVCVLADDALLSLAEGEDLPELWTRYLLLPDELKQAYDHLNVTPRWVEAEPILIGKLTQRGYDEAAVRPMARVASVFHSNAFKAKGSPSHPIPSSGPSRWAYALFPMVARINHSCTPNAFAHYRPHSGQMSVYTLRDIAAGEELEISYINMTMRRSDRRAATQGWSFTCVCPACSRLASLGTREYEGMLELIDDGTIPVSHGVRGSAEAAPFQNYLSRLRAVIKAAEDGEYTWLRAALPILYGRVAHCWRCLSSLGRSENAEYEADLADDAAWEWRYRIAGARFQPSTSKLRVSDD